MSLLQRQLINLTPHEINIVRMDAGNPAYKPYPPQECGIETIPVTGTVARVVLAPAWGEDQVCTGSISRLMDVETLAPAGVVEGLPDPQGSGTAFIVSMPVAMAAGRWDVFCPGELVRDEAGKPIGCRGLRRYIAPPPAELANGDELDRLIFRVCSGLNDDRSASLTPSSASLQTWPRMAAMLEPARKSAWIASFGSEAERERRRSAEAMREELERRDYPHGRPEPGYGFPAPSAGRDACGRIGR